MLCPGRTLPALGLGGIVLKKSSPVYMCLEEGELAPCGRGPVLQGFSGGRRAAATVSVPPAHGRKREGPGLSLRGGWGHGAGAGGLGHLCLPPENSRNGCIPAASPVGFQACA